MLRIVLTIVVPVLLPTACYLLYILVVERRRAQAEEAHVLAPWWVTAPWPWLVLGGVGLLALTLGTVALTGGAPPHAPYTPAHLEDGRVTQGSQGGSPAGKQ